PQQFVLPLDSQRCWAKYQYALNGLAQFHLFQQQTGHDGFSCTGVVRQQEPKSRLRQHLHVNRFDLVRQGSDTGKADSELAVVSVSEPNACRLDEQAQFLGLSGVDGRRRNYSLADQCGTFFEGEDRLVRCAVRQSNAAFVAGTDESNSLQGDGLQEVAGHAYALTDREFLW